jgi:hypothetical protein
MAMENKRWYEANKERQDLFENWCLAVHLHPIYDHNVG